jgi:hypothetical protein
MKQGGIGGGDDPVSRHRYYYNTSYILNSQTTADGS